MEYCGGGSIADLMNATDEPLEEAIIAYICKESLKVGTQMVGMLGTGKELEIGNWKKRFEWFLCRYFLFWGLSP